MNGLQVFDAVQRSARQVIVTLFIQKILVAVDSNRDIPYGIDDCLLKTECDIADCIDKLGMIIQGIRQQIDFGFGERRDRIQIGRIAGIGDKPGHDLHAGCAVRRTGR